MNIDQQQRQNQKQWPVFLKHESINSYKRRQRLLQRKRYEKRRLLFHALTYPTNRWALTYHYLVGFLMILDLTFLSLATVQELHHWSSIVLKGTDALILVVLGCEFSIRLWAAPHIPRYRGFRGLLRYIFTPFALLDLLVLIITGVLLAKQLMIQKHYHNSFDWLRFVQILKLIRLDIPFKRWRLVMSVVWMQHQQLYTIFYVCSMCLILLTFTMYFIEHDQPGTQFTSIPKTFWWSLISLLTIGYGDMYPQTTIGRIIASLVFLFSVSLYAVPSGIIATGIALKVSEQKRHKKKHIRRRLPAVLLIQWTWLYYIVIRCRPTTLSLSPTIQINNHDIDYDDDDEDFDGITRSIIIKQNKRQQEILPRQTPSTNDNIDEDRIQPTKFPITFRALCRRLNIHEHSLSLSSLSSLTSTIRSEENVANKNQPPPPPSQQQQQQSNTTNTNTTNATNHNHNNNNDNNNIDDDDSDSETEIIMNDKKLLLTRMLCLLQFQLARLRFQASNPFGDINDLIDRHHTVHEDLIKRLQIISNRLISVERKLERSQHQQQQQQ
ncbi:potassium voltage-gated channel subfamily KQT member 1 [Dermatophagoides farinae]|uniref:potassium voltage-gated channel subfamily KQT member 1 n=1 Tax=Dermatophagoides farinae TaxID=6954 RepID=UPI003F61E8F3